ncbi:YcxB family protein [Methylocystis heyeri]|uniref:YcxB-like C-terminal domain-containing protein n=1 Tax=Methylocystis heyeri TaxID=391905 RepID=A0A6B8KIX5_9HYPH|nr:YcxB family protein [Methylocystis heyeri]QGM46493.1 hypothetical protein H2LOC_012750 [Methylocystis heyeri]
MSSTISFSAEMNVKDYAAWGLYVHLLNRKRSRTRTYVAAALFFAFVIFLPIFDFWRNDMPDADLLSMLQQYFVEHVLESSIPIFAALAIYIYLSREKAFRSLINRQFHSLAKLVGDAGQTQLHEYRLDGEAIHVKMPSGALTLEWPAFLRFGETPEHFFVAYPWCTAVSIPKRALSIEQISAVRALLTEKIGNAGFYSPEAAQAR